MTYELINGKTSLNYDQMMGKVERGVTNYELQLMDELDKIALKNPEAIFDTRMIEEIKAENVTITSVHTPLYTTKDEMIETPKGIDDFIKTAHIAKYLAELQNRKILIIVHVGETPDRMARFERLTPAIKAIKEVLSLDERLYIGLENLLLLGLSDGNLSSRGTFTVKDNEIKFANVELAKLINNKRCGVVIDTCHAIASQNLYDVLRVFTKYNLSEKDILHELFKQSKGLIKAMHLNNAEYYGYDEYHGMPFSLNDEKSMDKLREIIGYYKQYRDKESMITIEVKESNYLKCKNLSKTRKALLHVLEE